jgi:hypothetical protein
MGSIEARNTSSLACPIAIKASVVILEADTSSNIDAVPTCKSAYWGIVNKARFNPALDGGFSVTGGMGYVWLLNRELKKKAKFEGGEMSAGYN